MFNLLMAPRRARSVRGLIGALVESAADTLRSLSPVETPAVEDIAPDPADVYGADEMPETTTIEAAAREYERATDAARRADRGKRAAKKILDKLPAGIYGTWRVLRTPASRQTPDLAAITAIFKANNLGPVPMKACAPSLKVEREHRATLGAHISWANTTDRTARTAPGSRAAEARFEKQARELHPDADDEFIVKVAENLRKAHYARMGLASAAKRRKAREEVRRPDAEEE